MKSLQLLAILLLVFGVHCPFAIAQAKASNLHSITNQREVAFTIDDLPIVDNPKGVEIIDIKKIEMVTRKLLSALNVYGVPAIGFVNEGKLFVKGETDARINILQMWLDAGMTIGNHTFSHADLNTTPLQQYMDEVIHGEVITRRLMQEKGFRKYYFRYPYNHTGTTREIKEAFQAFLKSRTYEIAPFTIEYEDYIFSDVYLKAKQKGDEALVKRIRTAYLDYLDTKFNYYEGRSRILLGREIKQIFLIHVNELNADSMDDMIQRIKMRGYSFITIDQALQDKAYQLKDNYIGKSGISWLHRWMIGLGKELDYKDDPDPPKFIMDLYQSK
jgi:peptidoglycan-N-acetylglucosamine deacetylase